MGLINKKPGELIRLKIADLKTAIENVPSIVTEAQIYADGGHRQYIERIMAARFATKVERRKDERTQAEVGYIAKSKEAAAAAIRYGLMEVCSIYTFPRILSELAVLYGFGADYEYIGAAEGFGADVAESRAAGYHDQMMNRLDWQACAVGSGAMLVQVLGSRLNYQTIERPFIWVAFADEISEDGEYRPVDKTNIDEASVVIVQLSGTDSRGTSKFVAMFGASEQYPQGRMVTYHANNFAAIPDIGEAENQWEYQDARGNQGNPLTMWKQSRRNWGLPEYPICQWLGGLTTGGISLLPVDASLYLQAREIDLAASRILMSTLKAARGLWTFERDAGASQHVPDSIDEGIAMLEHGTRIEAKSGNGANSVSAMDVLSEVASHTAAAFGIPPHRMNTQVGAQLPSGAALIEANKPLEQARQRRWQMNRSNAQRKFHIECALASMVNTSPVGEGVIESWTPKPEPIVQDSLSRIQEAQIALQLGITDVVRVAMQVYPNLDTEEKARNYIDSLETKEPEQAQAQPVMDAAARRMQALSRAGVGGAAQ